MSLVAVSITNESAHSPCCVQRVDCPANGQSFFSEDELVISKRTVIWRSADHPLVKVKLTCEYDVVKALWCEFPPHDFFLPYKRGHVLAVLQSSGHLTLYALNGKLTQLRAPVSLSDAVALPNAQGLLIQSGPASVPSTPYGMHSNVVHGMFTDDAASSHNALFLLQHPLEEFCPCEVTMDKTHSATTSSGPERFLSQEVLVCSLDLPGDAVQKRSVIYVVLYDLGSRQHKIRRLVVSKPSVESPRAILSAHTVLGAAPLTRALRAFVLKDYAPATHPSTQHDGADYLVCLVLHTDRKIKLFRVNELLPTANITSDSTRTAGHEGAAAVVCEIDGLDAVAVAPRAASSILGRASMASNRMLVLTSKATVAMYAGPCFLHEMTVPAQSETSEVHFGDVVGFVDPVHDCVTISCQDKTLGVRHLVRVRVVLEPTDELVQHVMAVLECFLPRKLFAEVQCHVLRNGGRDEEWDSFLEFVDSHITIVDDVTRNSRPRHDEQAQGSGHWLDLLASDFQSQYQDRSVLGLATTQHSSDQGYAPLEGRQHVTSPDLENALPMVFAGLHLLYEDAKLATFGVSDRLRLARLQLRLLNRFLPSSSLASADTLVLAFRDYYQREGHLAKSCGASRPRFATSTQLATDVLKLRQCVGHATRVPSVFDFVKDVVVNAPNRNSPERAIVAQNTHSLLCFGQLLRRVRNATYSHAPLLLENGVQSAAVAIARESTPCQRLAAVATVYFLLYASPSQQLGHASSLPNLQQAWLVVETLAALGFSRTHLQTLPCGVAQPLWELLERLRECSDSVTFAGKDHGGNVHEQRSRARESLCLIGREDLAALWHPIFNRSLQLVGASPPPPAKAGGIRSRPGSASSGDFAQPSTIANITTSAQSAASAAAIGAGSSSLATASSPITFIRGHHLWKQRQHAQGVHQGVAVSAVSAAAEAAEGSGEGDKASFRLGSITLTREAELRYAGDSDGLAVLQESSSLRFKEDRRMKEVCRLLRSSKCAQLRVDNIVESSDAEFERAKMRLLLQLCKRSLALPVGRGMLTFGSALFSVVSGKFPLPPLSMMAKVPPNNARLSLEVSNLPDDFAMWPEFHNGAAAGFRLGPAHLRISQVKGVPQVSRSWILYNCNKAVPTNAQAGFLLALGLQGHLRQLRRVDIVNYLQHRHSPTLTALLLGRAAGMRGTCDDGEYRLMQLHLPSLFPARAAAEIYPSLMVQTAALLGLSLLYQESGDRLMIEYLLSQIGHNPLKASEQGQPASLHNDGWRVEGYSLAAGLGLGLVALGRGGKTCAEGLEDLHVEDRLLRFMSPGSTLESRSDTTAGTGTTSSLSGPSGVGGGGGSTTGGWGSPSLDAVHDPYAMDGYGGSINFESGLAGPVSSTISTRGIGPAGRRGGTSEGASAVLDREGVSLAPSQTMDAPPSRKVNVSITAAGATLGLGLMYLRSENNVIAARLQVPTSLFQLDYVRPDLLALRMLAHSLVMWKGVTARPEWVARQVPPAIADAYAYLGQNPIYDFAEAPEVEKRRYERYSRESIDWTNVREARANIISGACMAIGIKYAGTGHAGARATVLRYLLEFKDLKKPKARKQKPKQSTLGRCIGVLATSLAMVMAGTGDLDVLRVFRALRSKGAKTSYGHHMALHIAIGLLFLGGGKFSLNSQSNEAVAALVISFFHVYPHHTKDGRYHLQALRHFYVLAMEYRCLQFCDADTGEDIIVPVRVEVEIPVAEGGTPGEITAMELSSPCLLPPLRWIKSIAVTSPRYWPLKLELDGDSADRNARIVTNLWLPIALKRRCGYLSHERDAHGKHSLIDRPFSAYGRARHKSLAALLGLDDEGDKFCQAFHSDAAASVVASEYAYNERLTAFAWFFCNPGQEKWAVHQRRLVLDGDRELVDNFEERCMAFRPAKFAETMHECLVRDKEAMLPVILGLHLSVWRLCKSLQTNLPRPPMQQLVHHDTVRDVQLLEVLYGDSVSTEVSSGNTLIGRTRLEQILVTARDAWGEWQRRVGRSPLIQYLEKMNLEAVSENDASSFAQLVLFLTANHAPSYDNLVVTNDQGGSVSLLEHLRELKQQNGTAAAIAAALQLSSTVLRTSPTIWMAIVQDLHDN